jgi:hypothetical protein
VDIETDRYILLGHSWTPFEKVGWPDHSCSSDQNITLINLR